MLQKVKQIIRKYKVQYILTKLDEIAENWNIDKYLLRYLILKEFANNEKWQNELIEKIRKNG